MSTLSVHLSNYNDAHSIGEAIEAICNQSRPPDEFIIIDDGSTDNSIAVIQNYMRHYPMIRLEQNNQNQGVIYTINRGLHLAKGEYIYFASANDRILPGFFEKSMALLSQYPQTHLCCTAGKSIDVSTDNRIKDGHQLWHNNPGFLSGEKVAQKHRGLGMFGTSYITRRKLMIDMGGYLPQLKWHCDYFLHHMIAFRYGTCYIPEELVIWRYNPASGYSSGRLNPKLQKQVFVDAVNLMREAQYHDLIPLIKKAGFFSPMQVVMNMENNLSAILECFTKANYTDASYLSLLADLLSNSFKLSLINSGKQIYAHSFHHYDRLRTVVRNLL